MDCCELSRTHADAAHSCAVASAGAGGGALAELAGISGAWPGRTGIAMPLRTLQCHNPGIMALDNAQIASAVLGMLLPLIGGLAVWPSFAWGKRVAGSKAAAVAAWSLPHPAVVCDVARAVDWDLSVAADGAVFGAYGFDAAVPSTTLPSAQAAPFMSSWCIFLAGGSVPIALFFKRNFVLMVIVGLYGAVWLMMAPNEFGG